MTLQLDPKLTALFPMLYVAWADGELTAEETQLIRGKAGWLSPAARGELDKWLTPGNPPSTSDLLGLRRAIRQQAASMPGGERMSLAELGARMAAVHGEAPPAEVLASLKEIEEVLGLFDSAAVGDLVPDARHEQKPEPPAPSVFDEAEMLRALDGPAHALKKEIREFLAQANFRHDPEMPKAEQRQQGLEWLQTLASHGYGTYAYPGVTSDETLAEFVAVFESLAACDLSLTVKYGVQFGLFGGSIYFLGSDEQRQQYLPDVAAGRLLGCFAMSEHGHGSNVRDLETTATYDVATQEFVIHTPRNQARKDWIGNAAEHGELATVFAQLLVPGESGELENHGVHAVLVPIRRDGKLAQNVRIEDCGHKMGLNGVDNGRIWFDSVRVPRENLLARYAQVTPEGKYESEIASPGRRFFTMIGTLVGGRVAVGNAGNRVAQAALTTAIRYADRRRQFGPEDAPEVPIMNYQTHKLRLLPRLAKTYALSFAFQELVQSYVDKTEDTAREVEAMAAALKVAATWHATDVVQACREACGGQGYLSENRFYTLKNDCDIFTTFEGDNTVLSFLVAKSLLTDFRMQFAEERVFGLARYISQRATSTIAQTNPIAVRQTDSAHLRSADFWLGALRFRETDLVASAAARLQKHMADSNPFDAANAVGDHMVTLARAYSERLIAEAFWNAAQAQTRPSTRDMLTQLAVLYGLSCVHEDSGWFQEQGVVGGSKARAIRAEVVALCDEIRPQAVHLVNAFGISDALLDSRIGRREH
ncbi:MAG: acyl-CoA dehydrogenase [bacterium]